MTDCPYSKDLLGWAAMARCDRLSTGGDAWILDDGEMGYWLRFADRAFTLTETNRWGPEEFVMQAADLTDVERWLTALFGSSIRSYSNFRRISGAGVIPEGVNPAYRLQEVDIVKVALVNTSDGQVRVIMGGGLGTSAGDVTKFSWIADASLEDLRASYLDPDGLPLFPGLEIIQDPAIRAEVDRLQYWLH